MSDETEILDCPNCPNQGWLEGTAGNGDPIQCQCQFCYCEPRSRFNVEKIGWKWVVHIHGPDDIEPCDSEIDALRKANEINKQFAIKPKHELDPIVIAVAENQP